MRHVVRFAPLCLVLIGISQLNMVLGQQAVAARNMYERVWAVVPMIGAGTHDNPKRPLHAPLPPGSSEERAEAARSGIISFSFQVSDDGNFAIVEFVARDRKALAPILNDNRPEVKVFEKGRATKEAIQTEFRKYKRDFDIERFGGDAR